MLISSSEVARGRAMAEGEMLDRYRFTRPGAGVPVFDTVTGQYTDPEPVVVFEGRGRMQVRADINSNAVEATFGDHEWTYRTAMLQLPIAAGTDRQGRADLGDPSLITPDCTGEVIESPLDPSRVGRVINIVAETKTKTLASSRKFGVRELLA